MFFHTIFHTNGPFPLLIVDFYQSFQGMTLLLTRQNNSPFPLLSKQIHLVSMVSASILSVECPLEASVRTSLPTHCHHPNVARASSTYDGPPSNNLQRPRTSLTLGSGSPPHHQATSGSASNRVSGPVLTTSSSFAKVGHFFSICYHIPSVPFEEQCPGV
jgi:hypothetical protein